VGDLRKAAPFLVLATGALGLNLATLRLGGGVEMPCIPAVAPA
jgi:hypothetical protein